MLPHLDLLQWTLAVVAAVVSGMSKSGIVGVGLVAVWLMAEVFPARESTGMLLLVLISADAMAAGAFRRHADWRLIGRLMPPALVGLGAGWLLMGRIPDNLFKGVLGGMVLTLMALQVARGRFPGAFAQVPHSGWFAWLMGFLMGVSTLMANAAGPVATLYLLARGADKLAFVGTAAWFFLAINWIKVPFSVSLGLMRPEFPGLALVLLPAVWAGVLGGRFLLRRMSQDRFEQIAIGLSVLAAIRLILG